MIPSDSVSIDETRAAEIASGESGEPVGACLYLSATELQALGIDVEGAQRVVFSVDEETGKITVEEEDA